MSALREWLRRWPHRRFDTVVYYTSRNEVPTRLPRRAIAVVGTRERPKWAIFRCPCGRGHEIALNLSPTRNPFWQLAGDSHAPSLYPSVDSYSPHPCHYWIREGRVCWAVSDS